MKKKRNIKPFIIKITAIIVWIIIWQLAAMIINNTLMIVSPLQVLSALGEIIKLETFWQSIWGTFSHITLGFLFAVIAAIILSVLSCKIKYMKDFLSPPMIVFRTVPVASFIILLLIALQTKENLSTIICFMMTLPILYANTLAGLNSIDNNMLEMAKVFQIKPVKKFVYLYTHQTLPFFSTGCKAAIGLCWKAGIAAELIGLVQNTIGNEFYYAKLYLMMDRVFAWTVVIILLSVMFEIFVLSTLRFLKRRIED